MNAAQDPIKILIVDDSSEDREVYIRHLKKVMDTSDYCIFESETGQEGIQLCKDENPDCILLDYLLPDMDGLEFLSLLKEKGYPGAVIMLTGQGSEQVAVEAMKNGAQDYLVKDNFSFEALNSAILKAVHNNQQDETKKWKTQALVDPLTHVLNRNSYKLTLEQTMRDFSRYKDPTILMVADIDHFKRVNDTYGHKAGDGVLRSVATALNQSIRASDLIFRYGGDEFVILLKKCSLEQGKSVAEKARLNVEESFSLDKGHELSVTVSLGLTQLKEKDTEDSLFQRADQALYKAKSNGRNRVEIKLNLQPAGFR
jgi:two-component system cell cycle response regulator